LINILNILKELKEMVKLKTDCEKCNKRQVCKFYSGAIVKENMENELSDACKETYKNKGFNIFFDENISVDDILDIFDIDIACSQFIDEARIPLTPKGVQCK
jgi:hypothetical protein